MSGNYRGGNRGGGGGTKDFKADPIKQFLISRGSARDRAVELCCAGKITLAQIPDYTDRLTVLHFGHISVDPQVDLEVKRIAARCVERSKQQPASDEHGDQSQDVPEMQDLCDTCADYGNGCQVQEEERPIHECHQYYNVDDAHADAEMRRQQEEEEQRRAEAEAEAEHNAQQEQQANSDKGGPAPQDEYKCETCGKTYATLRGLQQHSRKAHDLPA